MTLQANKVQKYNYCFAYAVGVITHRLQQMTKYNGEQQNLNINQFGFAFALTLNQITLGDLNNESRFSSNNTSFSSIFHYLPKNANPPRYAKPQKNKTIKIKLCLHYNIKLNIHF